MPFFYVTGRYPSADELADLRTGDDGRVKLTASWFTLLGTLSFPILMMGSITCSGDDCEVRSDRCGFAQAWSVQPGDAGVRRTKCCSVGCGNSR